MPCTSVKWFTWPSLSRTLRTLITQVVKSVLIFVTARCISTLSLINSIKLFSKDYSIPGSSPMLNTLSTPLTKFRQNLTLLPTLLTSDVLKISKILLPYILPRSLDYVIFLDSELLVVSDIQELWELASELNEQKKLFARFKGVQPSGPF